MLKNKTLVFVGFWQVLRLGGWAYRGGEQSRQRLQHPAAASVDSGQCGRSQKGANTFSRAGCRQPAGSFPAGCRRLPTACLPLPAGCRVRLGRRKERHPIDLNRSHKVRLPRCHLFVRLCLHLAGFGAWPVFGRTSKMEVLRILIAHGCKGWLYILRPIGLAAATLSFFLLRSRRARG